MVILEKIKADHQNTLYTYIANLADQFRERSFGMFEKFIDEQLHAIDDTKVTVKKRSGILPFIRIFPVRKGTESKRLMVCSNSFVAWRDICVRFPVRMIYRPGMS
jgi:hypothetical protein